MEQVTHSTFAQDPARDPAQELERHAKRLLTEELFRMVRPLTWSHPLTCLLVTALMWSSLPTTHLLIWLSAVVPLTLLRVVLYRQFYRRKALDSVSRWHNFYIALEAAFGLHFGLLALALPLLDIQTTLVLGMILLLTLSGASTLLAHSRRVMVAFLTGCNLPLLLMLPQSALSGMMTAGIMLYLVYLYGKAFTFNRSFRAAIRLQVSNQALVEALDEQRQQAEQTTQDKIRFLANLCHELRTPMQGMLGSLELLGQQTLGSEAKAWQQSAQQSGQRLLNLLNESLELTRLEQSERKPRLAPFEPASLVQEVCQQMQGVALNKQIQLSYNTQNVPSALSCDEAWLRQILLNLLSNALKFTERGYVSVQGEYDAVQHMLTLQVKDSGPGMSATQQEKIFTPFTQLNASHVKQGSGLGLAISRHLAEQLGGSLRVESTLGEGSCFILQVPAKQSCSPLNDDVQLAPGLRDTPSQPQPLAGIRRVLLVEDDPLCQRVVQALLEDLGVEVDCVADGLLAVERAKAGKYPLILMDWQLPGCDGLDATRKIREITLSYQPWIVGLTAQLMPGEQTRWQQAGMDAVLNKPVNQLELKQLLHSLPPKTVAA